MNRKAFMAALAALFAAVCAPVFAHGGFEHVTGNVVKVAGNILTIKTSTGNVDVMLDTTTAITKGQAKAQQGDLLAGTRVVIDVPEDSKDKVKVAHAVKISAPGAPAAAAAAHDSHAGHDGH